MTTADSPRGFVLSLQAGDEEAVALLVETYWAPGYRMALRMCGGDSAAAEDVAQEALISALASVGGLSPERSFRPWFYRIVGNAARQHLRGASRRRRHEEGAPAPSTKQTVEGEVSRREQVDALRQALDGLPDRYRETLSLRFLEGLSLREVAEVLGCREGTVSSRIRRGLDLLRRRVGPALAALGLTVLLPEVAQAEEVPPPPDPTELLRAAALRPPSASTRSLAGWLAPALLLGLVALAVPLVGAATLVREAPLRLSHVRDSAASAAAPAPPAPGGDVDAPLQGEDLAPEPEPAPGAPQGESPAEPVEAAPPAVEIDAMVLSTEDGVLLTVGSDDRVQVGLRFRILRGQREVGTVTVVEVRRDSCVCTVTETAPGETIQMGDQATTEGP